MGWRGGGGAGHTRGDTVKHLPPFVLIIHDEKSRVNSYPK